MPPPSEQTLLITGANGFVGGHIIQKALDKGYHVRGSVRSERSGAGIRELFADSGRFSLSIIPDISIAENYESAFKDSDKPITGVINVAAPFSLKVEDNVRDLLEPAVKGAQGILEATKRYGHDVKRIVSTSSFAAIVDIPKGYRPGYTYTEEVGLRMILNASVTLLTEEQDWNPMSKEEAATVDNTTAYCCSKALAEHAIWDFLEKEQPDFDVVTINPPWVFGPRLDRIKSLEHLNESTKLIWNLVDAEKIPPVDFAGFCDVRTLADAHISAFEVPEAANKRFLCGSKFSYQMAADILRDTFPELLDRVPVGSPGVWREQPMYAIDGSRAEDILGISYVPIEKTMSDTMAQLLEAEKVAA